MPRLTAENNRDFQELTHKLQHTYALSQVVETKPGLFQASVFRLRPAKTFDNEAFGITGPEAPSSREAIKQALHVYGTLLYIDKKPFGELYLELYDEEIYYGGSSFTRKLADNYISQSSYRVDREDVICLGFKEGYEVTHNRGLPNKKALVVFLFNKSTCTLTPTVFSNQDHFTKLRNSGKDPVLDFLSFSLEQHRNNTL